MQVPTRIPTPAELRAAAAAAGLPGAVVHLRRLDPHPAATAVDDGRTIYPASMIKVPLAAALEAVIARGERRYTDRVVVEPANLTFNDAPSPMIAGYEPTLAELEDLMLERSDNVATNVLIDVLGRERATAEVAAFGLRDTRIARKLSGSLPLIDDPEATARNRFPAADAAALFGLIAQRTIPGAERLDAILARQYWSTKLSAGLAPGDTFAHKTGETDEVCHDGGILRTREGATYVLVVYTELPSNDENDARFGAFLRSVRPLL